MFIVAVQRRQAVAQIIEWRKEQDGAPVVSQLKHHKRGKAAELEAAPFSVERPRAGDGLVDVREAVPKEAQERVTPDVLRLAVLAVPVDRQQIDRLAPRI